VLLDQSAQAWTSLKSSNPFFLAARLDDQVNGKKELTGRTDLDVDINNQCGRLIANAVIACCCLGC
jgi:hypothetical protein